MSALVHKRIALVSINVELNLLVARRKTQNVLAIVLVDRTILHPRGDGFADTNKTITALVKSMVSRAGFDVSVGGGQGEDARTINSSCSSAGVGLSEKWRCFV